MLSQLLLLFISFFMYFYFIFLIYWGHYRGPLLAGIWLWQVTSNLRGPCSRIFYIPTSLLSSSASEDFRVSFTRIWISSWDSQLFGSSALVLYCISGPSCPYWIKMGNLNLKTFKTQGEREIFAISMICN